MPIYTYQCPECGWTGDRRALADERDEQHCDCTLDDDKTCGAKLAREEIPLAQARMSYNWSLWQ